MVPDSTYEVGFTPKAIADLKRIRRYAYFLGIARGNRSEKRVEEALKLLAQNGEIFNYHKSVRDGENDRLGWDFLVAPQNNWLIPLQVKSSDTGLDEHVNEYGMRTPCVVVKEFMSLNVLAEKILIALSLSTKFLEEEIGQNQKPRPFNPLSNELRKVYTTE